MLNLALGLRLGLAFGLFCQAGLLILRLLRIHRLALLETVCIAFGLGAGLVAFEMQCLSFISLPLNGALVLAPWGILWLIYLLMQPRPQSGKRPIESRVFFKDLHHAALSIQPAAAILTGALAVIIVTVFFRAAFHPIVEWDGWAIWDLKAQAFYHDRSIFPFVNDSYSQLTGFDYPLLSPLAGAFLYLILGQATDKVLLLTAAFYAAALGIFFSALRRYGGSRTLSLGLTLGFAAVQIFCSGASSSTPTFLCCISCSPPCCFSSFTFASPIGNGCCSLA
jgi:hypothetical protein